MKTEDYIQYEQEREASHKKPLVNMEYLMATVTRELAWNTEHGDDPRLNERRRKTAQRIAERAAAVIMDELALVRRDGLDT